MFGALSREYVLLYCLSNNAVSQFGNCLAKYIFEIFTKTFDLVVLLYYGSYDIFREKQFRMLHGCKLAGISAIIHSSNRGLNSFQNMSNLYDILIEIHTWILYTIKLFTT